MIDSIPLEMAFIDFHRRVTTSIDGRIFLLLRSYSIPFKGRFAIDVGIDTTDHADNTFLDHCWKIKVRIDRVTDEMVNQSAVQSAPV
jgi:hypothetical protein